MTSNNSVSIKGILCQLVKSKNRIGYAIDRLLRQTFCEPDYAWVSSQIGTNFPSGVTRSGPPSFSPQTILTRPMYPQARVYFPAHPQIL